MVLYSPDIVNSSSGCHKATISVLLVAELRKEKGERAIGGVTPGEEAYYAAVVQRVPVNPVPSYSDYSSDMVQLQRPPIQQQQPAQQQQPVPRPPAVPRSSSSRQPGLPGALAGGAEAGIMQEWSSPEVSSSNSRLMSTWLSGGFSSLVDCQGVPLVTTVCQCQPWYSPADWCTVTPDQLLATAQASTAKQGWDEGATSEFAH